MLCITGVAHSLVLVCLMYPQSGELGSSGGEGEPAEERPSQCCSVEEAAATGLGKQ